MSTLTQFLLNGGSSSGGGSGIPQGAFIEGPITNNAILEQGGDYYVRTGTRVMDLDSPTVAAIAAKSADYLIPDDDIVSFMMNGGTSVITRTSFAHGNGVIVASTLSSITRSSDGVNWSPVEIPGTTSGNPLSKVIFAFGLFIVIIGEVIINGSGSHILVATSADAATWTYKPVRMHTPAQLPQMSNPRRAYTLELCGTSVYLTRSTTNDSNSDGYLTVIRSSNGIDWTSVGNTITSAGGSFYHITKPVWNGASVMVYAPVLSFYADSASISNALFYGTTTSLTSGVTIPSVAFSSVKFLNNLFIGVTPDNTATTTGRVSTSTNGNIWTGRTLPTAAQPVDVTYGAGVYVIVCLGGLVFTSPDAVTWTQRTSGTAQDFRAVEYDSSLGLFIGLGAGSIHTSPDGIAWIQRTTPPSGVRAHFIYDAPGSGQRMLKADGYWYAFLGSNHNIVRSADGITWQLVLAASNINSTGNRYSNAIRGTNAAFFEFNGRLFAFSATGGITTATKNSNLWTTVVPEAIFQGLAYGNGTYVAVGNGGVIYTSSNGLTWTPQTSGTATAFTAVVWTGTNFVAMQGNNTRRSPDGISWTAGAGLGGQLIVATDDGVVFMHNSGSALIYVSKDHGVTWDTTSSIGAFIGGTMTPIENGAILFSNSETSVWVLYKRSLYLLAIGGNVSNAGQIGDVLYVCVSASFVTASFSNGLWSLSSISNVANPTNVIAVTGQNTSNNIGSNIGAFVKMGSNTYMWPPSNTNNNYDMMVGFSNWYRESSAALQGASAVCYDDTRLWAASQTGLSFMNKTGAASLSRALHPNAVDVNNGVIFPQVVYYRKIT